MLHDCYELLDGIVDGDPDEEDLMGQDDEVEGIILARYVYVVGSAGESE